MSDLSDFLTSVARFFVKIYFHKKCGVFEACKKAIGFFDTLGKAPEKLRGFVVALMLLNIKKPRSTVALMYFISNIRH